MSANYPTFRISASLLTFSLAALLAGCSAGSGASRPGPAGVPELPPVSGIAQALQSRQASYAMADLQRSGDKFDPGLPNQLAVAEVQNGRTVLSPSYSPNSGLGGLAYCLYSFKLPGYDLNPQLNVQWTAAPGEAWLALANWGSGRWDFLPSRQDGHYSLPSLSPYFDAQANLVVALLSAGSSISEVTALRIGSEPPSGQLSSDVCSGPAPLSVNFGLANVSDPDGTVKKIEWDLNGDADYEISSGMSLAQSHVYVNEADYTIRVRLTDDAGAQTVLASGVSVGPGWAHTYGFAAQDFFSDLAPAPQGGLYTGGITYQAGGTSDAILARLAADGSPVWVKSWDAGSADSFCSLAADPAGALLVAGSTFALPGNSSDILIQKYNPDGSLAWSKLWGSSTFDTALAIDLYNSDVLLSGTRANPGGDRDIIILRLSGLDGSLVWEREWDSPQDDCALDICVRNGANPLIALAGTTHTDYGDPNALLLLFDTDGNLLRQRLFGDGAYYESGVAVCLDSSGIYFAIDEASSGLHRPLLLATDEDLKVLYASALEVPANTYLSSMSWGSGGTLLLCGQYQSVSQVWKLKAADGTLLKALSLDTGGTATVLCRVQALPAGLALCGAAPSAQHPMWLQLSSGADIYPSWSSASIGLGSNISPLTLSDYSGTLSPGGGQWDQPDVLGEAFIALRAEF